MAIPAAYGADAKKEIAVVGPVEALNCSAGRLQVLGVAFQFSSTKGLAGLCSPSSNAQSGYVAVRGDTNNVGEVSAAQIMSLVRDTYVPGASTIFIRGAVTSIKPEIGQFKVSGTSIVFSANRLPRVGDVVEVVGTQPALSGLVLADSVHSPAVSGIIGSGVATSGIIGSGLTKDGIIGSGKSKTGIIGSGKSTSGIIGSGLTTSGIIGSGLTKDGIIGSGKSTSGIIGSGVAVSGIIGSGKTID